MLTALILKMFVPEYSGAMNLAARTRCGVVSGIVGIVCNVLIAAVKITLAVISGSIAIAADAVNNLSDAGAGVITVAGFRISARPPDAEHPFGHGRTEYIAGLVISLIIVGLGITFFKDSVVALFRPSKVSANGVAIVIFSATVIIKCWLFFFYRKVGKMIDSEVIRAAALDSLSDCLSTGVVIISLIAARYTSFPVDGCAGLIVAGMILWSGFQVLKETVSKLVGEPPAPELVTELKRTILSCPGIDGVHDVIIHNYGADSYYATAHAEISCDGELQAAHDILENAEVEVGKKMPVHLLLHGDPYSKDNPQVIKWRSRMENEVSKFDSEFKLYDFRLGKREDEEQVEYLSFHLLIPHKYAVEEDEIKSILTEKIRKYDPEMKLKIVFLKSFV